MSVEDNLTQDLAIDRYNQLEVPHMRVHLDISDKTAATFKGWVELDINIKNPWIKILLDCISQKVHSVKLNGSEVPFIHANHKVTIEAQHLSGKQHLRVEFTNLYDKTGVGLHRYISPDNGQIYLYTDLEPFECHKVFPCFNQPDIKSIIELSVKGPRDWIIASNSIESTTTVDSNSKTVVFNPTKPLPAYLFGLIAGEYAVIEGGEARVPMKIYCRQSMRKYLDSEKLFKISKQAMDFYERHFEIEYPFDKYDQVFVPEYPGGAMENAGLVIFTEDYLFRHKPTRSEEMNYYNTVVHEMAHMWYGNLITMKWWGDLWLKESVATYYGYYALTQASDFQESMLSFTQEVKARALKADQYSSTHPIVTPCPDTNVAFQNFDSITYEKAASMIQQLIFIMSFENFRKGLVSLLKKFSYANFDHNDFLEVMQEYCPINLTEWGQKWLHTAHVNTLILNRDQQGLVRLEQGIQNPDFAVLRPHKLRVEVYDSSDTDLILVGSEEALIEAESEAVFKLTSEQQDAFLFLNKGDHAYARTYLDKISWNQLPEKLHLFEDPLDRQVLLNCVFSMVEDSVLSPMDFLKRFPSLVAGELSNSLKISLIENAHIYYWSYLPHTVRVEMASEFRNLSLENLGDESLHYDVKSAWYAFYLSACDSEAIFDDLPNIITSNSFHSMELDLRKKWSALRVMAFHYHSSTDESLKLMLQQDTSDESKKDAHTVRCALRKDKLSVFEEMLEDQESSADFLRSAMVSFFHRAQKEDCREVMKTYFNCIDEIFKERDRIFSRSFGRVMFPACFESEALSKVTELLQKPLTDSLFRVLVEHRDRLLKIQRIREKFFAN